MTASIVIPALDEEAAVGTVVSTLPKDGIDEVVVCDNGSRDRTAEVARAAGATVVPAARRGYGSACLAGLATCARVRPGRPPSSSSSTPTARTIRPSCPGCSARCATVAPTS